MDEDDVEVRKGGELAAAVSTDRDERRTLRDLFCGGALVVRRLAQGVCLSSALRPI